MYKNPPFGYKTMPTVAALLLCAMLFAACAAPQASAPAGANQASEPIKIGYMGPLTGPVAFVGEEQSGFVEAAVQIFNEEHGTNIELVPGDSEINPDIGRVVAERFAADADILAVVGPAGSQVCEATQPIFAEAGLAHITPSCTRTDLTQPGTPTFFRPIPTDADQSKTDAAYMVDVLDIGSAFLVDDQTSYGTGITDELVAELRARGVTEIQRASVSQEETDFSSIATSVMASEAELVFFASQVQSQLATLSIQLREQGYAGYYFLPDGGFQLDWVDVAGAAADGAFVSFFAPDPKLVPEAQPYTQRYAATHGEEFGAFGGAAAFATYIALEAIDQCVQAYDVSRACVVDALANLELDTSPLGIPVAFGPGNQLRGSQFFLFQIQNGEFALLDGSQPIAER
jgi:branched-chain amino acid transport system substrate-binding protein